MQTLALPPWFGLTLMAVVCGAAVWKGGWEERLTAMAFLIAWIATLIGRDREWLGTQWGAFAVDVVLLGFLVVVALKSARYWPIFAAGFHLLSVATHAARIVDPQVGAWAYATASVIFSQLTVFALAAGVIGVLRERQSAEAGAAAGATRR
ncbi:conserved hypothetical protein [Phenylobacterium zucineum HLK1]|uniref:Uncharacterized protein n=1 Tax=Phenylobacterium zucineum (strain HLK1) TaxID=450851 RepID=B4RC97_PHEZH|nr:hypothetical protein [Phenylobacterium zucineum]ACG79890.1 conserved hypothetical protein [Phenylobacterium zucineum HLK1]